MADNYNVTICEKYLVAYFLEKSSLTARRLRRWANIKPTMDERFIISFDQSVDSR